MEGLKSKELLQSLMNGGPDIVRKLMPMATREMIEPMLEKTDMLKFGGDLLASAIFHGKADIVQLLIERGADIMSPPDVIPGDETYRKTPFVFQAIMGGNVPTLKLVLQHGGSISDFGFACLSKKRKNMVITNALGCAAYHGHIKMVEEVMRLIGPNTIDLEAMEEQDKHGSKSSTFQKEWSKYTAIMLTVAKGDENLDCLKYLLKYDANYNLTDISGNTLLHIAATNGNNKLLDYIAKNLKIDLFARNKNGETALNVCQRLKNNDGVNLLS